MSRCLCLCVFALSSCSLLFESTTDEPTDSPQEEDLEFMIGLDGDAIGGSELYVVRTIDDQSFIERYAPTATPTLLEGRFDLPHRPTAVARSRSGFPSLLIMATGDADDDGTQETEYINRLDWTKDSGVAGASFDSTFPHELGPALPGLDSHIMVSHIIPDNSQLYTTGREVRLVDALNGWDDLEIDPEPLLSFEEPIRCLYSHNLGLSQSELVFFAESSLVLVDANTQEDGQTLHDVEQRVLALPFSVKGCAAHVGSSARTYLATDGANLHVIRVDPEGRLIEGSLPLPGEASHERVIYMDFVDFENQNDGDRELVLIVDDPPTLYLGFDPTVDEEGIRFSASMVAQPLDWTPTAAVKLNNGEDGRDRLYISEAKAPPRCFELDATGLAPALVPCMP